MVEKHCLSICLYIIVLFMTIRCAFYSTAVSFVSEVLSYVLVSSLVDGMHFPPYRRSQCRKISSVLLEHIISLSMYWNMPFFSWVVEYRGRFLLVVVKLLGIIGVFIVQVKPLPLKILRSLNVMDRVMYSFLQIYMLNYEEFYISMMS